MDEEFKDAVLKTDENTEAQTVEETEEGIELSDTATGSDEESPVEKENDSKPEGRFVTEEEINEMVNRRVRRKLAKSEREQREKLAKYQDTENILRATLEVGEDEDVNDKLRSAYEKQGVKLPEPLKPGLSEHQIEVLAKDDANQFIEEGYDAMFEEAERLANIGYNNLSVKDKVIFNTLAEELTMINNKKDLKKIGASEDILKDEKFLDFKKKFNSTVPIKDVYELYMATQPKKQTAKAGSMKGSKEETKKTFYTDEEINKLTSEELDDPEVWEAVRRSMTEKR